MNTIIETIKGSLNKHDKILKTHQRINLIDSVGFLLQGTVTQYISTGEHQSIVLNVLSEGSLLKPITNGWYVAECPGRILTLHRKHLNDVDWPGLLAIDNYLLINALGMLMQPGEGRIVNAINRLVRIGLISPRLKNGVDLGRYGKGHVGIVSLIARMAILTPESTGRLLKRLRT